MLFYILAGNIFTGSNWDVVVALIQGLSCSHFFTLCCRWHGFTHAQGLRRFQDGGRMSDGEKYHWSALHGTLVQKDRVTGKKFQQLILQTHLP